MAWTKTNDQKSGRGSGNPVQCAAFANPLTPGSLIIVSVLWVHTGVVPTPSDTAGNSYVDCGEGTVNLNTSTYKFRLYYALNTFSTASNVVQIANASNFTCEVVAVEFTGGKTTAPVDVYAGASNQTTGTGGGNNMSVGPVVTNYNNDLVIACHGLASAATVTVVSPFSAASQTSFEYDVQASAGSIEAYWACGTNSDAYGAIICAFLAIPTTPQALTAVSSTLSAVLTRVIGLQSPLVAVSSALAGALTRITQKLFTAASATMSATITKTIKLQSPLVAVSAAMSATLARVIGLKSPLVAVSSALAGILIRTPQKLFTAASATMSATIAKTIKLQSPLVAVSATLGAALTRTTQKSLAAVSAAMSATLSGLKLVTQGFTAATATVAATLIRTIDVRGALAAASAGFTGTLGRSVKKLFTAASAAMSASLVAVVTGAIYTYALSAATAPMSGALSAELIAPPPASGQSTIAAQQATEIHLNAIYPAVAAANATVLWQAGDPYPDLQNPVQSVRDVSAYVEPFVGDTGASPATGAPGAVPAPPAGSAAEHEFLMADGMWEVPPTMTGDSGAGGKVGYVPAPGAGSAAAGKFLKADATWEVPPTMTGDSGAGGKVGYVPAPGAGSAAAGAYLKADGTWAVPASGSVTSVGLSMPAEFSVADSPVTGSGTLTVTKANESPNTVFAGPSSGGAAPPTFRALANGDLPSDAVVSSRLINTTSPLSGGGDLSADRTLAIGNLPVANLNSGSGATASTFWRGDGTWAAASPTAPFSGRKGDGSTGRVNSSGTYAYLGTGGCSVHFWFNPAAVPGSGGYTVPVEIGNSVTTGYFLLSFQWNSGGTKASINIDLVNGVTHQLLTVGIPSGSYPAVGVWSEICATWDGTTLTVYVNGTSVASGTKAGYSDYARTIDFNVLSSGQPTGWSYSPDSVAEAAFWTSTLTATDAANLAQGYPATEVESASLRWYWKFMGTSPEPDLSGSGFSGTVTGTTTIVAGPSGTAATGVQGPTGPSGTRGSLWYSGSGAPGTIAGQANGDWYLDTGTGNVYELVAGTWTLEGNIKGATGATGPAATPWPLTSLSDTFPGSAIDTTKWCQYALQPYVQKGTIGVSANVLTVTPATSTIGYTGITSIGRYDMRGKSFSAQIVQVAVGGSSTADTILLVGLDSLNCACFVKEGDTLYSEYFYNGTKVSVTSITYNASTMAYWRIREASGTLYFEYSANGSSWTTLGSGVTPNPVLVSDVWLGLFSGCYASQTISAPAEFANVALA